VKYVKRDPAISIILPVKNEGLHIQNTMDSILQSKTNYSFEMIVVDDGSTDGCCHNIEKLNSAIKILKTNGLGAANARNLGGEKAIGDYLIFCDAHLFVEDYFIDRLIAPITKGLADAVNPTIGDTSDSRRKGFGFTWTPLLEPRWNTGFESLTQTPLLAGGCLAISQKIFHQIGGFERGFKTWGREDEEISLKLWLMGFTCAVEPACTVLHVFRENALPFKLSWDDINYNLMRMAFSHFNELRIDKCKGLIQYSDPDEIIERVLKSGVLKQREEYFKKRIHDDDWFMNRFSIQF
jgi:glycosyltransferase involved in cell wall biosynthesis